jgi:hypothetical protein
VQCDSGVFMMLFNVSRMLNKWKRRGLMRIKSVVRTKFVASRTSSKTTQRVKRPAVMFRCASEFWIPLECYFELLTFYQFLMHLASRNRFGYEPSLDSTNLKYFDFSVSEWTRMGLF